MKSLSCRIFFLCRLKFPSQSREFSSSQYAQAMVLKSNKLPPSSHNISGKFLSLCLQFKRISIPAHLLMHHTCFRPKEHYRFTLSLLFLSVYLLQNSDFTFVYWSINRRSLEAMKDETRKITLTENTFSWASSTSFLLEIVGDSDKQTYRLHFPSNL